MVLLELKLREGSKIINLDHVQTVEFEQDSLDLWIGERLYRNIVRDGASDELRKRFNASIKPIYEGRMNNVLGIRIELDISDLQPDRVPF
jgi:hypothetical protein